MPSTEISSTCLLTGAGARAAALAEPGTADSAYAATAALAARHAKVFRLVTGTPVRADLFGVPEFFSSQGEIRVPVRRTTLEPIEATCRLLAMSREFGATSTNYPGGARGLHFYRRERCPVPAKVKIILVKANMILTFAGIIHPWVGGFRAGDRHLNATISASQVPLSVPAAVKARSA